MTEAKFYLGCPACCSFAGAETEEEAERRAEAHNGYRHDDEEVARVIDPDSEDSVNEFMDDARDLASNEQYKALIKKVTRGNTPYNVGTVGDN